MHGIGHAKDPEPKAHRELFISSGALEELIRSLKNEGYRFKLPMNAGALGVPTCCITFDDGYYNNRHFLETAEQHAIPFILFLNSYNVLQRIPFIWDIWEATRAKRWSVSSVNYQALYESLSPDERELLNNDTHRPFTPEELTVFASHPLVHLAPHGHTHQPLVGKYGAKTDQEIDANLKFLGTFKSVLPHDFSMPCGLYTKGLKKKLLTRFKRIYTIDGGGFYPEDRIISRISLINPEYGGPLREQIQQSFGFKKRTIKKVLNFRYSNRLCYRIGF
jgi:peptidoglycan/xylan/chitin deacetylase (PgdA/CDA1 family)